MISPRLRFLFGLSIPFFVIHGIEEYLLGFYDVYPLFHSTATFFQSTPQGIFLAFQIMWWLVLLVAFFISLGGKWQFLSMTILGLIYFYELHHLFNAFIRAGYYPGLLTSLPLPIIGIFFWKELIDIWRNPHS